MPKVTERPAPVLNRNPVDVGAAGNPLTTAQLNQPGKVVGANGVDSVKAVGGKQPASVGGVTAQGLNPAVSPELQKATWENVFKLGRQLSEQGKVPVIMLDHRLTALDDRPIIRKGMEALAKSNNITELKDLDAAMANGTLKFLPGYTEQASDAWRDAHPDLVAKYPNAFGSPGSRIPINFMGYSVRESNATEGLLDLQARWKLETGGKGEIIFAGSGAGTRDDFAAVYSRPVAQGGGGISNPDVRFGAPNPSAEADAKAQRLVADFNAKHPNDEPVELDHDSRGKAGWIETIEKESVNGQPKVVAAFVDDRAHNRIAVEAAASLGTRMLAIKSDAPGISFSQLDNGNENQISTFKPNP